MRSLGLSTMPETPRHLRARLQLIIQTLPATVYLNPLWAFVLFLPFFMRSGTFGQVPILNLAVGLLLHLSLSVVAYVLWRRYHKRIEMLEQLERLRRKMVALQFGVGIAWGVTLALYSRAGEAVNNVYVAAIFVSVVWSVLLARGSHMLMFFAGVGPLAAIYWLHELTLPGEVAHAIAGIVPVWIAYIVFIAVRGAQRIDDMLQAQFANEDLSNALRASNAEALKGRQEAETASAAKTTFLANMSHELRTPLNAILGFSDIIRQQSLGPAAAARYSEYASDIHASGSHLLNLINDLLDVAKIEAGKMQIDPRPIDAAAILPELERLMAPRAREKHQALRIRLEPGLPFLMADERAFKQIVLNLLTNAVKFTPPDGRIALELQHGEKGGLLLAVSDNGPGIAQDKIERLFEPFSQIDNRFDRQSGGTGLGLALVRGLVTLHGGKVWIESVIGHGTKVCVYFPLVVESRALPAVANG